MRIGVFPGSFDPVTNGHLDIIARAAMLVDRLIVGVAGHSGKRPLFPVTERVVMAREAVVGLGLEEEIEVLSFDGLLVSFAQRCDAGVIIRGLRAVSDFEYEFQMVAMNSALSRSVETVFLTAGPDYQAISSYFVRQIAALGGPVSAFVPAGVERALQGKYSRETS